MLHRARWASALACHRRPTSFWPDLSADLAGPLAPPALSAQRQIRRPSDQTDRPRRQPSRVLLRPRPSHRPGWLHRATPKLTWFAWTKWFDIQRHRRGAGDTPRFDRFLPRGLPRHSIHGLRSEPIPAAQDLSTSPRKRRRMASPV